MRLTLRIGTNEVLKAIAIRSVVVPATEQNIIPLTSSFQREAQVLQSIFFILLVLALLILPAN